MVRAHLRPFASPAYRLFLDGIWPDGKPADLFGWSGRAQRRPSEKRQRSGLAVDRRRPALSGRLLSPVSERRWLPAGILPDQRLGEPAGRTPVRRQWRDRKSTRLNSSHVKISYAVFCLKKRT